VVALAYLDPDVAVAAAYSVLAVAAAYFVLAVAPPLVETAVSSLVAELAPVASEASRGSSWQDAKVVAADSFAAFDLHLDQSYVATRVARIHQEGHPVGNSWVEERERELQQVAPCQDGCIAAVGELDSLFDNAWVEERARERERELHQVAPWQDGCIAAVEDLASKIHQKVRLAGKGYFPADLQACIADKGVVGLAARIHRVRLVGNDFLVADFA